MRKRIAAALTALVALTAPLGAQGNYGLPEEIQDGNILHCFCWPIKDIRASLKDIAEAGFGAVQLSPLQRKSVSSSSNWSDVYRPYDFSFQESAAMGSADDLKALCSEAAGYGIKVIVDVVANHVDKANGYYDPWWKSSPDYVRYWGGNANINYNNRYSITHDRLGDYAEVNSENPEVIARAKAYVEWLRDAGVSGIRWDAAKHIGLPSEGCNFWSEVTSVEGMFHYGEILGPPANSNYEGLIKEYAKYMSVTDNRYSDTAAESSNGIARKKNGEWAPLLGATSVIYWAETHDTYSNTPEYGGWSSSKDQELIDRAYAAVACRDGAAALYLSRPNAKGFSNIRMVKGSDHFKSKPVAEVNKFRNKMHGRSEYFSSDGNAVSVTRNNGGAVIVVRGAQTFSVPNGGGLCPAGSYTDRVSGNTITVTPTTISGKADTSGIVVIYNDTLEDPDDDAPEQDFDSGNTTIYYDNSVTQYGRVTCHYWGSQTTSFPGLDMTRVSGELYSITLPEGTAGILFADRNSSRQTVDVASGIVDGFVYKGLAEMSGNKNKVSKGEPLDMATNGVGSIEAEQELPQIIYDLRGIRVTNPQPGNIYIIAGKKVIFRN